MGFNLVNNIEHCFVLVRDSYPLSLIYYSHIISIVAALVVGIFVFVNNRKSIAGKILLMISLTFSLWVIFSLITWTSSNSAMVMFIWSFFGILTMLLFAFSLYLSYAFIDKKDIDMTKKMILGLLLLPIILLTATRFNLINFSILNDCEATENEYFTSYYYLFGLVIFLWILFLAISRYRKAEKDFKKQIVLFSIGIEFFLISFFVSGYISSITTYYELEFWGILSMAVFMGFLAYLIVQFKAFNIKLLKAQALMVTLAILIGALYFYVTETGGRILILINLALAAGFGYMLVKSVKKEVEQKEELEVANKKIKVAYFKLEELDKAKAEFTSLANHQLKHAPTSIKSLLGMFLEGDYGNVPDNQLVALKNINVANERQIRLADDLLQIIKMESNKVQLDFQKQRIEDVCQGVYDNLSATAKERSLKLSYEKPEQALPEVLFDKSKVFEAIFNFVDNAIKYTKEGGVAVKAEVSPSSNYKPQNSDDVDKEPIRGSVIRVTVSDTGSGISKENLGQLFAKFSRKDTAKLNSGGTGLGLYLVKLNIEAHGGRTWAESDGEGKGSRFIMELPIETPREILEQNEAKN